MNHVLAGRQNEICLADFVKFQGPYRELQVCHLSVSIISTPRVLSICLVSDVESSCMQMLTGIFAIAPKIPNAIPVFPVDASISVRPFNAPEIVAFDIIS